MSIYWSN